MANVPEQCVLYARWQWPRMCPRMQCFVQGAAAAKHDRPDHAAAAAGHHLRGGRPPQARSHQRLYGRLPCCPAGTGQLVNAMHDDTQPASPICGSFRLTGSIRKVCSAPCLQNLEITQIAC